MIRTVRAAAIAMAVLGLSTAPDLTQGLTQWPNQLQVGLAMILAAVVFALSVLEDEQRDGAPAVAASADVQDQKKLCFGE